MGASLFVGGPAQPKGESLLDPCLPQRVPRVGRSGGPLRLSSPTPFRPQHNGVGECLSQENSIRAPSLIFRDSDAGKDFPAGVHGGLADSTKPIGLSQIAPKVICAAWRGGEISLPQDFSTT